MPAPLQLVIDLPQLGPHPFRLGLAPNPEPPLPPGRTDVRETEEGERLRLTQPARPTTFGRVASEFDQPCLVRVKLRRVVRVRDQWPATAWCVLSTTEASSRTSPSSRPAFGLSALRPRPRFITFDATATAAGARR